MPKPSISVTISIWLSKETGAQNEILRREFFAVHTYRSAPR
jgi:hypothetical protein